MVEVMKIMVTSFKRSHARSHSCTAELPPTLQQATSDPHLHRRLWTLMGKSGSVSCGVTAPFSWVLVHTRFCLSPKVWLGVYFVKVHAKTSTTRLCFLGLYTLYAPRFNTTSLSYFLVSHISLPFGILFHAFW